MPWQFDPNLSRVLWSVKYLGIATVHGRFTDVRATLNLDSENSLQWRTDVVIQAASIYSGYDALDNHVRNADFLDAERYPTIEFHTSKVEALPSQATVPDQKVPGVVAWEPRADHFRVIGSLTLRGITKPAELDTWYFGQATDIRQMTRRAFRAQTSIRRSDFNIYQPPQIDPARTVAGEVVDITIDLVANRVQE